MARNIQSQQTKGQFKLAGIVSGTSKDKFYVEEETKKGTPHRKVSFGLQTHKVENKINQVYVALDAYLFDNKKVFFYSKDEKKTTSVDWSNRTKFKEEGYKPIGINIGLLKKPNDKGQLVNDNQVKFDYDAVEYIAENLKDNDSVFVLGELEFNSYKDENGNTRSFTKAVPKQISLCKNDIEFTDGYEKTNGFNQTIVVKEIINDTENKRGLIVAYIIGYSSISTAEFVVKDKNLFAQIQKKIKPYNAMKVNGYISGLVETEEADDDHWGEADTTEVVSGGFKTELVITGVSASTIDTETYTEELIASDLAILSGFSEKSTDTSDDWGTDSEDDLDEWA